MLAVNDGRLLRKFNETVVEIEQLTTTSDGRLFGLGVTGDLFELREGVPARVMKLSRNGGIIGSIAEGNRLIVAARDGTLRIATVDDHDSAHQGLWIEGVDDLLRLDLPQGNPLAIGFDVQRDEVAVVTSRGRIRVWSGKADERSVPRPGRGRLAQILADEVKGTPAKTP